MIELLPLTKDNLIALKASDKLVAEDYAEVLSLAEKRIDEYGKVKFYMEIEDFESITATSIWHEVKFNFKHFNKIEKIAVVGEKNWQHKVTIVMKGLTPAEVRYFDTSDKKEAISWIE
jgi:hypothetical protein